MRRAAKRDANEPEIVCAAQKMGWWMTYLNEPGDWLGFHPVVTAPWFALIEIKRPDGPKGGKSRNRLTKTQTIFHLEAQDRGAKILLWKDYHDVIDSTNR